MRPNRNDMLAHLFFVSYNNDYYFFGCCNLFVLMMSNR